MAETEGPQTFLGEENKPIDITRWPDVNVAKLADVNVGKLPEVQHRFSVDSPVSAIVDVKNAIVKADVNLAPVEVKPVKADLTVADVGIKPVTAGVTLAPVTVTEVGLKPVNVGFSTDSPPVKLDLKDASASVAMNIATPNPVSLSPVALRFVLSEPIVAKSDYTFSLTINKQEILSVSLSGTTTIRHPPKEV